MRGARETADADRTRAPRVAVLAIGDANSPALWSGTPHNIVRALREAGAEVEVIDIRTRFDRLIRDAFALPRVALGLRKRGLRPGLDRERRVAQELMTLAWARQEAGRRRLARVGPVDGVIQIGTGYRVFHPNVVSYEDMTVAQARVRPEMFWDAVPRRMAKARLRQQRLAYRRNRGAAFSTDWAARSAVAEGECPSYKAHAVGIGANFLADPQPRDWATPRFLFVGREWSRKSGDAVVAAFAEVRRAVPDAELHLVGHHPAIDAPGVVGHGPLDLDDPNARQTMLELWSAATCCVVPSRFEPAGIIYVEAMHAGIPSIGTTQGGAADLIGDAGATVDPDDVASLTRRMLDFCDPSVAAEYSERAHERSARFTWAHVAASLLDVLELGGLPEARTAGVRA